MKLETKGADGAPASATITRPVLGDLQTDQFLAGETQGRALAG